MQTPPILAAKQYDAPSVFTPQNLLREARRQKSLAEAPVPSLCVLDPDGDIVRYLRATGQAELDPHWACYHTELYRFCRRDQVIGIIGCAVGAPFAVLVAEELFAAGCQLLVSITSSGQITPLGEPPYFILIERALRDEGTSYHYLPPAPFSLIPPLVLERLAALFVNPPFPLYRGSAWTTDAPFRETEAAIRQAQALGILAVEMEAAALYAFAGAKGAAVVCFAHVTNQMARKDGDFEKGADNGSAAALRLIDAVAQAWWPPTQDQPGQSPG
jgi:uridine phosphorylase